MKVYISQLTETENIIDLLEKYEIGLEIVLFASPYCLDRQDEFIENYKRELGDLYGKINLGIHGPYADLIPGARDELITKLQITECSKLTMLLKKWMQIL